MKFSPTPLSLQKKMPATGSYWTSIWHLNTNGCIPFWKQETQTSADKVGTKAITSSMFAGLNVWAKAAIQDVSEQRSDLGAVQNRLEHTINNLDNVVENTTSAESAIRDTDMATEMVKYSNSNILAQAGQAMLAQSNQANQGVLSLLQ